MAEDYVGFGETPIEARPYGAIEGIDTARKTWFANQAKMQSLADMFLAQQMKEAELQRYQGETPSKLDEAAFKGAQARGRMGSLPELLAGEVGEAQTKAAQGRVAGATADSDIEVRKSDAQTKISSNELTSLSNMVSSFHAQMTSNPMMAPYLYSQMREAIPENLRSQFPETFTPKVMDGLGKMKQALSQTIPHLQAMELQRMKEEGDTKRAGIAAKATTDAAATRAAATVKSLATLFNDAVAKGDNERVLNTGSMILAQPELADADRKQVEAAMAQARRNIAVKQAPKYQPPIGNLPGSGQQVPNIIEQLRPGSGAPGTNTGIPGVTRVR